MEKGCDTEEILRLLHIIPRNSSYHTINHNNTQQIMKIKEKMEKNKQVYFVIFYVEFFAPPLGRIGS